MVSGMKEGLVIDELMGAEQGNIMGGDFGGNILLGYKVENGEIVGRVKDAMLSGNIYNVFKQQIEIGNEIRDVDGIMRTPPIYCPSLPISTRGG
jgi:PmbA protein